MKRIVFAVTNDLTYDRRMHRICATLQSAGYEVRLVGRRRRRSAALVNKPYQQKRLHCFFTAGPFFYAEYNIRLFFYLLVQRADIFGACDLDTALAVRGAAWLRRRHTVFDAHEHFAEVPEVERRKTVKAIWHAIGQRCIPGFDLRFTVGESLAAVLGHDYHASFSVIRNLPILRNDLILPAAERRKELVYIGALNEGRGLEVAITAMRLLPDFTLKLIGEGDLSRQLRELADLPDISSRITFTGWVPPHQLHAEIASAMVGLNALEARSKSYYHSLANKFFDYMHAGVPSLNMDFPEYSALVNAHAVGVCIEKLSPEMIAETVREMTSEPGQLEMMIDACRYARNLYCWQKEESSLLALFTPLSR